MVCVDYLQGVDLYTSNASDLLKLTIDDVGASNKEREAFIDRVNQSQRPHFNRTIASYRQTDYFFNW